MSAGASPYALFLRSIERRSLAQAEAAARELGRLDTHDALALVLLMGEQGEARYERAVVRWLGQWVSENEGVGLDFVAEFAGVLGALQATSPPTARARAAVMLRHADDARSAEVLERW